MKSSHHHTPINSEKEQAHSLNKLPSADKFNNKLQLKVMPSTIPYKTGSTKSKIKASLNNRSMGSDTFTLLTRQNIVTEDSIMSTRVFENNNLSSVEDYPDQANQRTTFFNNRFGAAHQRNSLIKTPDSVGNSMDGRNILSSKYNSS